MIIGIQLVGTIVALFMLYLTFLNNKKKYFSLKETFVWFFIWMVVLIVAISPTIFDLLVKETLGFSRRLDFFIIIGFFFLTTVLFYVYANLKKTQKDMTKLVQQIAIESENFKR